MHKDLLGKSDIGKCSYIQKLSVITNKSDEGLVKKFKSLIESDVQNNTEGKSLSQESLHATAMQGTQAVDMRNIESSQITASLGDHQQRKTEKINRANFRYSDRKGKRRRTSLSPVSNLPLAMRERHHDLLDPSLGDSSSQSAISHHKGIAVATAGSDDDPAWNMYFDLPK